jgi:hypothetical protein
MLSVAASAELRRQAERVVAARPKETRPARMWSMDPPGQQDDLPFDWLGARKPETEFASILRWMAVGATLFLGFDAGRSGPGPGHVVYAVIAGGVLAGGVVTELICRSRFRRSVTGLRVEGRELVARRVDSTLTRHPLDAVTSVLITDLVSHPRHCFKGAHHDGR